MPTREQQWSTATILGLIALIGGLLADRVIVAVQIEANHGRIMALEEQQRQQDAILMLIRERQVKNEERITILEQAAKR